MLDNKGKELWRININKNNKKLFKKYMFCEDGIFYSPKLQNIKDYRNTFNYIKISNRRYETLARQLIVKQSKEMSDEQFTSIGGFKLARAVLFKNPGIINPKYQDQIKVNVDFKIFDEKYIGFSIESYIPEFYRICNIDTSSNIYIPLVFYKDIRMNAVPYYTYIMVFNKGFHIIDTIKLEVGTLGKRYVSTDLGSLIERQLYIDYNGNIYQHVLKEEGLKIYKYRKE